jgi:hypothetical protein
MAFHPARGGGVIMVDPGLVLFAIQAAVTLGRKTYDVLVDSTQAAPLVLPIGTLAGSPEVSDAIEFFRRKENRALREDGGPYHGLSDERLVLAYRTVRHLDDRLGADGRSSADAVTVIQTLHKFEQHKAGFGPRSPWQRIAGTVLEIGIDYFAANPQAMGKASSARHVVEAFLVGIQDIPFAEGEPTDILGETLMAGLKVLGDNTTLVSNDARIHVLLGGVTQALRADLLAAGSLGQTERREELFRRITASILRGGAGAIAGNADLFIQGSGKAQEIVRSTVAAVLGGVRDHEDLFSLDALEDLFGSALRAVAANAPLLSDQKVVQALVQNTVRALTDPPAPELFSGAAVGAIARAALETVGENAETLLDPRDPQRQLIADALRAVALGLAADLGGGRSLKQILSTTQLIELSQIVFREVAMHPERLLGAKAGDPRRTALAQILGSVASALGEDPTKLVNGTTFLELVRSTLTITRQNLDKLLDLSSSDPKTNLLYKVLDALAEAALSGRDAHRLLDRETFVAVAGRVLRAASANIPPLLAGSPKVVADAVVAALDLSTGALEGRINGENLPAIVEGLLRAALRNELALADRPATLAAVAELLRGLA